MKTVTVPGCATAGCPNPAYVHCVGLCNACWQRNRKHGSTDYLHRPYSSREDKELMALPTYPRTGRVLRGYLQDLALSLGRSVGSCDNRRRFLKRQAGAGL